MKIVDAKYVASVASKASYPESNSSEILLLGRSNVGKSSFINTILNRKAIAHISGKPGKTQTLNFYLVNDSFYLVDAPGYGYAKVNRKVRETFGKMIEEYLVNRENLKVVCLLIDMRHEPTNDDLLMFGFLEYYNIPTVIIATKCDKLPRNKKHNTERKLKAQFNCPVVSMSSLTKEGREDVLNTIAKYL